MRKARIAKLHQIDELRLAQLNQQTETLQILRKGIKSFSSLIS